jgi:hypothetical protein
MALSGTSGYVQADGVAKSGDKWTFNGEQVAVDRANFTTSGEPSNAAGQRTGQITFEGPYEDAPLGVDRGTVYTFKLGITAAIFLSVPGRVTNVTFSNDAKDGPRFSITAQQHGAANLAAT